MTEVGRFQHLAEVDIMAASGLGLEKLLVGACRPFLSFAQMG